MTRLGISIVNIKIVINIVKVDFLPEERELEDELIPKLPLPPAIEELSIPRQSSNLSQSECLKTAGVLLMNQIPVEIASLEVSLHVSILHDFCFPSAS